MSKKPSDQYRQGIPAEMMLEREADLTQRLAISLAANEDPVTAAERAVGVGRNQLDPRVELGLVLRYQQMEADKAEWEGDTFFSMSWDYLLNVLQKQGFEKVYAHDFAYREGMEEFGVWVKKENGLLLHADSYNGKTEVSSTALCYELALPAPFESLTEDQHSIIVRIRFQGNSASLKVGDSIVGYFNTIDTKKRLIRYFGDLEASGLSTNVPWKYTLPQELWSLKLYDFVDAKEKEAETVVDSWKIKNERTMNKLPKDVREMLGWVNQ